MICLNPECRESFRPGHYGKRQQICSKPKCKQWYKGYWSQTRKPPRGIPDKVFHKLEKASKADPLRHAAMVVARESGLRKGELLGIVWGDILDRKGKVCETFPIRGQWSDAEGFKLTKTKEARIAYLLEKARRVLERLISHIAPSRPSPTARVFPLSESSIWSWFVDLQECLGIINPETGRPYRWHDMRHSLGVELVRAGRVDLAQKMLGHRKIETTMGYAERAPEEILAEVEKARKRKGR